MNRNFFLATIITGIVASPLMVHQVLAQTPPWYSQVRYSVVLIQNISRVRQGTGFIVGKDNTTYYVLTAGHVLEKGQLQIRTNSGDEIRVDTAISLPGVDLALLQFTSNSQYPVARLAKDTKELQVNTEIFALGYPASEISEPQFPSGVVTSRTSSGTIISHNLVTDPGMSGSPVLNRDGEVVGIHVGRLGGFGQAISIDAYRSSAPSIFTQTARDNLAEGRFDQSIAGLEQVQRLLGQDSPEVSVIRAYAYFGLRQLPRAREEARKVSNNAEASLLLGSIDYLDNNFPNAIVNLNRAVELDRRNLGGYALAILGLSYTTLSPRDANFNAFSAIRTLQDDPFVYLASSCVKWATVGDRAGASADLESANRLSGQIPTNPFLKVISLRLQETARSCLPSELGQAPVLIPSTVGRYKSSEPISLGVGTTALAVSNDSQFVAVGLRDGTVSIYNLQTRGKVTSFSPGGVDTSISSVAFSPNSRDIAIAATSGQVKVFDIRGGTEDIYNANAGSTPRVVFSNNGRYLFIGGESGTLRMVEIGSNETIAVNPNTHTDGIGYLTVSPDGRLLVSGGGDGKVKLWSTIDLNPVGEYQPHSKDVRYLAFSADSNQIISADFDVVKSCNWQTNQCSEVARSSGVIRSLAASNGTVAFSADSKIFLQDLKNNRSLGSLSGHADNVDALAYTPDGRYLISGSYDRTMIIWEVQ